MEAEETDGSRTDLPNPNCEGSHKVDALGLRTNSRGAACIQAEECPSTGQQDTTANSLPYVTPESEVLSHARHGVRGLHLLNPPNSEVGILRQDSVSK